MLRCDIPTVFLRRGLPAHQPAHEHTSSFLPWDSAHLAAARMLLPRWTGGEGTWKASVSSFQAPSTHRWLGQSQASTKTGMNQKRQHKVSLPSQLAIKNTERNENRWTGEKRQCMSTNLTHNAQKKGANGNKRIKLKTSTFLPPLRSPSTSLVY